jgi:hypothetical protein
MPAEDAADAFTSNITVTATAHAIHPEGAVLPEPEPTEE